MKENASLAALSLGGCLAFIFGSLGLMVLLGPELFTLMVYGLMGLIGFNLWKKGSIF